MEAAITSAGVHWRLQLATSHRAYDMLRAVSTYRRNSSAPPLHMAVELGHLETVARLIEEGADVSEKDQYGNTVLHLLLEDKSGLVWNPRLKFLQRLKELRTAFHEQNEHVDMTLHHGSERWGPMSIIKLLLDRGAVVNEKNEQGDTALHLAAKRRRPLSAIWQVPLAMRCLLRGGADIYISNACGHTALEVIVFHYGSYIAEWAVQEFEMYRKKNETSAPSLPDARIRKVPDYPPAKEGRFFMDPSSSSEDTPTVDDSTEPCHLDTNTRQSSLKP